MAYISTGRAAKMFGVNTKTIVRWAERGMLPYIKTLGGHYRFDQEDIEQLRQAMENRKSR